MTNNVGGEFRVSGILKLRSRRGVYACGENISGSLSARMVVVWPVHGRALTMDVPIRGVKFVDYSPGVAAVALAVQFDKSEFEHEQLLRDLSWR